MAITVALKAEQLFPSTGKLLEAMRESKRVVVSAPNSVPTLIGLLASRMVVLMALEMDTATDGKKVCTTVLKTVAK